MRSHTYSLCSMRLTSDPAGPVIHLNPRWKLCWIHQSGKKAKYKHLWYCPSLSLTRTEGNQSTHQTWTRGQLGYEVIIFHCQSKIINYNWAVQLWTKRERTFPYSELRFQLCHICHCGDKGDPIFTKLVWNRDDMVHSIHQQGLSALIFLNICLCFFIPFIFLLDFLLYVFALSAIVQLFSWYNVVLSVVRATVRLTLGLKQQIF